MWIKLKEMCMTSLNFREKSTLMPESKDLSCSLSNNNQHPSFANTAEIMLRESEKQWKYIDALCMFLDNSLKQNDCLYKDEPIKPEKMSAFLGPAVSFSCSYYVKRILKYSGANPCCALAALFFMDRLQQQCSCLPLSSKTVQRLLLVAMMIATKYLEDKNCPNSRW